MAILKVARLGHPVLRQAARELAMEEIRGAEVQRLIDDMVETMHEYAGLGLAAPQVHRSIQLAVLELQPGNERYPDLTPAECGLQILINPRITVLDKKEQAYWEGCLSVPELRGLVRRPRRIRVESLDREARPRVIEVEGFLATVYQHELDHLQGTLFLDRMRDFKKLAFLDEYRRHWLPGASPSRDAEDADDAEDAEAGELGD